MSEELDTYLKELNACHGKLYHDIDIDEIRLDDSSSDQRSIGGLVSSGRSGKSFRALSESSALTGRQKRGLNFALQNDQDNLFGEVFDERGKKRFHGAFTGGFTAGFNNTVGSAEGWAPTEFSSSRSRKAMPSSQRISDYADDEDLQNIRLVGSNEGLIGGVNLPAIAGPAATVSAGLSSTFSSSIGEHLSRRIFSHLAPSYTELHEHDRGFQLLFERILLGHDDDRHTDTKKVKGPQLIPPRPDTRTTKILRTLVVRVRNFFEAESAMAVLQSLRTADRFTPLILRGSTGKTLMSLSSSTASTKAIEANASILPNDTSLVLLKPKSLTELDRSEAGLLAGLQNDQARLVMRTDESRLSQMERARTMERSRTTERARLSSFNKESLRETFLKEKLSTKLTQRKDARLGGIHGIQVDDEDDILDLDRHMENNIYDFELTDEGQESIKSIKESQNTSQSDEEPPPISQRDYAYRVEMKIKQAERSADFLEGFSNTSLLEDNPNGIYCLGGKRLLQQWKEFKSHPDQHRPPNDFSLRPLHKSRFNNANSNRNTSNFNSQPNLTERRTLSNVLSTRFTKAGAIDEKQESEVQFEVQSNTIYMNVRGDGCATVKHFVSSWSPNKYLMRILRVSTAPIILTTLPDQDQSKILIRNRLLSLYENPSYPFKQRLIPFIEDIGQTSSQKLIDQQTHDLRNTNTKEKINSNINVNLLISVSDIFDLRNFNHIFFSEPF